VVFVFPGLLEVFEAGMTSGVINSHREHLFRDQAGEAFVERHAQSANASRMEAKGRSQNQIRTIRLKQVGRADIGLEPRSDQRDNPHEGVGGFAAFLSQAGNFLQSQDMTGVNRFVGLGHPHTLRFFQYSSQDEHRNWCRKSPKKTESQPIQRSKDEMHDCLLVERGKIRYSLSGNDNTIKPLAESKQFGVSKAMEAGDDSLCLRRARRTNSQRRARQ
jgi:hypothetical protein